MAKARKTGSAAQGTKAAAKRKNAPVAKLAALRPAAKSGSKKAAKSETAKKAGTGRKVGATTLSGEMLTTEFAIRSAYLSKL